MNVDKSWLLLYELQLSLSVFLLQISVELTKVLLHLTDNFSLPDFRKNRFNSLVALTVTCPQPVSIGATWRSG